MKKSHRGLSTPMLLPIATLTSTTVSCANLYSRAGTRGLTKLLLIKYSYAKQDSMKSLYYSIQQIDSVGFQRLLTAFEHVPTLYTRATL